MQAVEAFSLSHTWFASLSARRPIGLPVNTSFDNWLYAALEVAVMPDKVTALRQPIPTCCWALSSFHRFQDIVSTRVVRTLRRSHGHGNTNKIALILTPNSSGTIHGGGGIKHPFVSLLCVGLITEASDHFGIRTVFWHSGLRPNTELRPKPALGELKI